MSRTFLNWKAVFINIPPHPLPPFAAISYRHNWRLHLTCMRIVFTTFGTLGDVNPLIALALEMRRRGHDPVLAVPEMFRGRIEPLGIGFHRIRPDQDPHDSRLIAMI